MKNFKLALVASVVAVSASGVAMAATDGALGSTSTGESIVTIIKQNAVQITKVADLNLGTHATLAADASASDPVCVFASTGGYNVTASSSNGPLFQLASGTDMIAYDVTWAANGGAAVPVVPNVAITGLAGDAASLNCGGGDNAEFGVTVNSLVFNAAVPGTYTDTLTLIINPE